jgi:methyltransferase
MTVGVLALVAFVPMILEAFVSARHERVLRSRGATEPVGDVIHIMQVAYPGAFVVMLLEGSARQVTVDPLFLTGAAVFGVAKALKYWAMMTLGTRWTFRVLVPPNSVPVVAGPYRFARHPNYMAVTGELVGVALMAHAWVAGPIVTVGFGLLMLARIRVEERALGSSRA